MRSKFTIFSFLLLFIFEGTVPGGGERPKGLLPFSKGRDCYQPFACYGAGVYLVCWKSGHLSGGDLRKGFSFIGDIVGCRLNREGRVLDPEPFTISGAADLQERPRIAFGGGVFFVVWQDFRGKLDWDIYGARVTPEGKVLDPEGIPIACGPHSQALPDVAWDGDAFQVVWQDFRSGVRYEIYGARVSAGGKVLDPGAVLLVSEAEPYSRINPVVASTGNGKTLLFWLGGGRRGSRSGSPGGVVAGCNMIRSGRVSGAPTYENASNGRSGPGGPAGHITFPVALTCSPSTYLVAWTTNVPYGRGNVPAKWQGAFFDSEGRLKAKLLFTADPKQRIRNPSCAWDGQAFVVAWDSWKERWPAKWPVEQVFLARVTEKGKTSDRRLISGRLGAPAIKPSVASDGTGRTLVVYEQHPEDPKIPIGIGFNLVTQRNE